MPALTRDEVRAGLVAYLEEEVLRQSEAVTWYEGKGSVHGPPERRPFACFNTDRDQCSWAPVTTEPTTGSGYQRIELPGSSRSGGDNACYGNQWIAMRQYLVDGANYYAGPIDVFIAASRNECSTPATRALLNPEGVRAIQEEVARQQRRRTKALRGQE